MAVKLEEQLRSVMRRKHFAITTERTYISWYKRFVRFSGMRHPQDLGVQDVSDFLSFLATEKKVAASTQNQALHAILFLYREVLKIRLEGIDALRAKNSKRLPVVLVPEEVQAIISILRGNSRTVAMVLYGCGLRISECLNLRVRDVDFAGGVIRVVAGKGDKDRVLKLPDQLRGVLEQQLEQMALLFHQDRLEGQPGVAVPRSIENRLATAGEDWAWFWVFASQTISTDPRSGICRRHHLHPAAVGRSLKLAARRCRIEKRVTAHTFRHSYATQLLLTGVDLRSVQEVMGHSSIKTTEVYTHVAHALRGEVPSPLDALGG